MEKQLITKLVKNFEDFVHEKEGIEFWFARDLQNLLGYVEWRKFLGVIEKAKLACSNSGVKIEDHFVGAAKMIAVPKGASKEIDYFMLTRYACYLVAQNGDPRKEEIAFAQSYFAIQTRKQELVEERIKLKERFDAREKLAKSETELSKLIYERGVDDKGFARIRSKGDEAMIEGKKILKETVTYSNSKEDAIKDTNILLVFTDWDEFKQPDFRELKNAGIKAIFDGRNLYDPIEVREQGIDYFGIGRN